MKHLIITFLFWLIGETINPKSFKVGYIFDIELKPEIRKKKWERALLKLWHDKDMLDFLFYQSESDKEKAWKCKKPKEWYFGTRARTLFLVYQAHRAFLKSRSKPTEDLDKIYKDIVD
jgi:hypothetical protein